MRYLNNNVGAVNHFVQFSPDSLTEASFHDPLSTKFAIVWHITDQSSVFINFVNLAEFLC